MSVHEDEQEQVRTTERKLNLERQAAIHRWAELDMVTLYQQERKETLKEEHRLMVAEIFTLLVVALFIIIRARYLV